MTGSEEFRPLVLISGLPVGGAENVTASFLTHLAETGRTVPVCTVTDRRDGPPAEKLARAGVPRFDLGARRLADPMALGRLVRLVDRERIDLIHAHGQDASIVAAAACAMRPTELVVTRHVLEEPTENARQRGRSRLTLASLRRADAVVAVSRAVARRLRSSAVPEDRIHVIPNGVETDRYAPGRLDDSREEVRRSLGFEDEARVLLLPAVMREGKGHDLLLRLLPAVRRRVPSVRVLFAGGGAREKALRHEAKAYAVDDVVRFLGFRTDVPELMAASDVVVLPSFAEALPTVLMEAAAASRPVVATRVGGTPEVVENGRTGLLVPPDDASALGDGVARLLENAALGRRFGCAARSRAERLFDIRHLVDRTLSLWSVVATVNGGRSP